MAQTKRDQIIAGLTALGYVPALTVRSKKYLAYDKGDRRYWVGKNGALRIGRTVSDSISCMEPTKAGIIRRGFGLKGDVTS